MDRRVVDTFIFRFGAFGEGFGNGFEMCNY